MARAQAGSASASLNTTCLTSYPSSHPIWRPDDALKADADVFSEKTTAFSRMTPLLNWMSTLQTLPRALLQFDGDHGDASHLLLTEPCSCHMPDPSYRVGHRRLHLENFSWSN